MTKIKLDVKDPRLAASQLRHAANHWNDGPPKSNPVGDLLLSLADAIEEQVPPAIEEPKEFGSVVLARDGMGGRMRWQKTPMHGKHYWESETGAVEVWSELTDVEVLGTCSPELLARLKSIKASRLTAPEKFAVGLAIQAVIEHFQSDPKRLCYPCFALRCVVNGPHECDGCDCTHSPEMAQ